jgi:UDPglucose 6-dehydrogenase
MARVRVVGQGYVGLTTALFLADRGHDVLGLDVDPHRVRMLEAGRMPFAEPSLADALGRLAHTSRMRFQEPGPQDGDETVLMIAVPVPVCRDGKLDLGPLRKILVRYWRPERHELVVVRSTLLPGSADLLFDDPALDGLQETYAYWPEFFDQGRALGDVASPDRVVIGVDHHRARGSMRRLQASLGYQSSRVRWHSVVEAEAVKAFSNAALAMNRILAGDFAALCADTGVNGGKVLASVAGDRRLSEELLTARPALYDSCLGKDLYSLSAWFGQKPAASLLRCGVARSGEQRSAAAGQVLRHLRKTDRPPTVLIVGLGFRSQVGDRVGALSEELIPALSETTQLLAWDPYVALDGRQAAVPAMIPSLDRALRQADVVVLCVEHPEVGEVDWAAHIAALRRRGGAVFDFCDSEVMRPFAEREDDIVHLWGSPVRCAQCAV